MLRPERRTLPARHSTARESPAFAHTMVLSRTATTTDVHPASRAADFAGAASAPPPALSSSFFSSARAGWPREKSWPRKSICFRPASALDLAGSATSSHSRGRGRGRPRPSFSSLIRTRLLSSRRRRPCRRRSDTYDAARSRSPGLWATHRGRGARTAFFR